MIIEKARDAGHRSELANEERERELDAPARRIETTSTHGTGCTLASAIAALLARGESLEDAITGAKAYVTAAIEHAYPIGGGHGPVHHFYRWWT